MVLIDDGDLSHIGAPSVAFVLYSCQESLLSLELTEKGQYFCNIAIVTPHSYFGSFQKFLGLSLIIENSIFGHHHEIMVVYFPVDYNFTEMLVILGFDLLKFFFELFNGLLVGIYSTHNWNLNFVFNFEEGRILGAHNPLNQVLIKFE